ncbi:MAG: hypothetical protein RJA70_2125 [Pseudomonadota bacterium]|jgi:hypothetical protein
MRGWNHLLRLANQPRSAQGLAAFRILFGTACFLGTCRFAAKGWISDLYVLPTFHFKYYGFEWVAPLPAPWMFGVFFAMGLSAALFTLGLATRAALAVFFLLFSYCELIDQSTYLNHYYLISLLALLLFALNSDECWSLNARLRPSPAPALVPAWQYWLLQAQMSLVYFFAGVAKLNADWLLDAEPLQRWMNTYSDLPLVGELLSSTPVAYAMSWTGAFFDLTIALWLLLPTTRRLAFVGVLIFHLMIWLLFPVGVFSWVMIAAATVFFSPSWPQHWLTRSGPPLALVSREPARDLPGRFSVRLAMLTGLYLALQVAIPLRHFAYPGWVNWTEEGFRFAWRVMLIEKTAQVEFRVHASGSERATTVFPREQLAQLQYTQMSTQPDMIQQYAKHLARSHAADNGESARVFVDAWASLNGRPAQRYIDPDVDLAAEPRSIFPKKWIVPLAERPLLQPSLE